MQNNYKIFSFRFDDFDVFLSFQITCCLTYVMQLRQFTKSFLLPLLCLCAGQ